MEKNILNSKRKRIFKERIFVLALLFYPLANFVVFYIIVNANSIFLAFKNIGINGEYLGLTFKNFVLAIDKITLSGGDPILQAGELVGICREVHAMGKDVMTYTGYTYDREEGEAFRQTVMERYNLSECQMYPVGGVIGTHVGKNCVALAFVRKA